MEKPGGSWTAADPGEQLVPLLKFEERVCMLVLDEADRMLDLGFREDVAEFAQRIRSDRQVPPGLDLFLMSSFGSPMEEFLPQTCLKHIFI